MLHNLAESDDESLLTFAVGWADGESEPTAAAPGAPNAVDGLLLPDDRTGLFSKATLPISHSISVQTQW